MSEDRNKEQHIEDYCYAPPIGNLYLESVDEGFKVPTLSGSCGLESLLTTNFGENKQTKNKKTSKSRAQQRKIKKKHRK